MTLLNADRWILSTLKNDATLIAALGTRIYTDVAPMDTTYPLAILSFVSMVPVENASADRVMDDEIWRIKVIGNEPSYKNLETLADKVRELLHKTSGTGVIGCVCTGSLRLSEVESGQTYKTILLEFELFTQ